MPESYANTLSESSAADGWDAGPQAYLNGDERAGATVNGKVSFTIDRAAVQLTGYTTDFSGALIPSRGWSSAGLRSGSSPG